MKKLIYPVLLLFVVINFQSCQDPWTDLFNGENLDGWDVWVGPIEEGGEAPGLNKDPKNLFSVVDLEGEKVLRISGEINASIATKEEFENYHLMVDVKWGDKVFSRYNSGLLYHSYGDFGVGLGVWMSSHELQLLTGNMGDSYRMGKSYCEIEMVKNSEGKYIYKKGSEKLPSIPGTDTRIVAKNADHEKAHGEWNTVELYCFGTTSVHIVNGQVNMINYNSAKYLNNGNTEPLSKGKIQFQSEGGELFLKNIKIKPINKIPEELLQ